MDEVTKRDWKIQALKEIISRDKVNYEDQIADLRVELTALKQESEAQVQELLDRINAEADVEVGEAVEDVLEEKD